MKTILTLLLLLSVAAYAQKAPEVPRLSGIVDLPEFKKAVFELKADCCGPRQCVLTEGESMGGVKLLSISSAQRSVQVDVEGAQGPITLILPARSNSSPASGSGSNLWTRVFTPCWNAMGNCPERPCYIGRDYRQQGFQRQARLRAAKMPPKFCKPRLTTGKSLQSPTVRSL